MSVNNKNEIVYEHNEKPDDFWSDINCEEKTTDYIGNETKKNFKTPNFSCEDLRKISPINIKEENYLTFEEFPKEKEFTLKKQTTIKDRLQEFILKHETTNEKRFSTVASLASLNSKKEKKVGEIRSNILYEKGLIKNELIKIIFEKNNEIKSMNEMKECTFKPSINKSIKTMKYFNTEKQTEHGKTTYDRNLFWKNKTSERIFKEKSNKNREEQFPFKPKLNKNNLDNVFYTNDKPNYLIYVHRLEQIRREQEEKFKQNNIRLPKNDNPKWNNYTRRILPSNEELEPEILFDNTQKSSALSLEDVKRSLHYKLHS